MIRSRRRRDMPEHAGPESSALARRLASLKADAQDALSKITEADEAIDQWERNHRGTSTA